MDTWKLALPKIRAYLAVTGKLLIFRKHTNSGNRGQLINNTVYCETTGQAKHVQTMCCMTIARIGWWRHSDCVIRPRNSHSLRKNVQSRVHGIWKKSWNCPPYTDTFLFMTTIIWEPLFPLLARMSGFRSTNACLRPKLSTMAAWMVMKRLRV